MKAVQLHGYGAIEQMYIGNVPEPEQQEDQVLIKVYASALNRADLLQRAGKYPPPPGESDILGLELAGEVIKPDNSGKWSIGDRVMALVAGGGQAEIASVHKHLLMPIPIGAGYTEAAAIPEVFLTAYQAMFVEGKLAKGNTILIHAGASGVGTAAIQLASYIGARVLVTCSAGKHKACLDLGASDAIDYKHESFVERISELTEGRGVDMILDFIGAPNFNENIKALGTGGQLIQVAMMGGSKVTEVNLYPILRKHISITGTTLRSRPLSYKANLITNFSADFLTPIASGKINPVIDSVYPLQEIKAAHERMAANKNIGKIVLTIN